MHSIHEYELNLITAIQSLRSPLLDHIFVLLNVFDYDLTYLIIIVLVWNLISEKAGFHLLYLQSINATLCVALKNFFAQPRPYYLLPSLKIEGTYGYGFPSGAAAGVCLSLGFIFFILKPAKPRLKIAALITILLVGLTRVYLGAHFPSDVLGGYALAIAILCTYAYSINSLTKKMNRFSKWQQLLIHVLFMLCLFMLHISKYILFLLIVLFGAVIWHLFFNPESKIKNKFLRISSYGSCVLAIAGIIILSKVFDTIPTNLSVPVTWLIRFAIFLLMGLWLGASAYIFDYPKKK